MYSKKQFAALERTCRERAALARKEMEYSLMEYWLAEAEEWKQLRQSDPFRERIANRSTAGGFEMPLVQEGAIRAAAAHDQADDAARHHALCLGASGGGAVRTVNCGVIVPK